MCKAGGGQQQAVSTSLTVTEQQVQNAVDLQNWAQAERKKDPKYKEKTHFSRVIQHNYPPDQFMTRQTACPSPAKEVPTNLYPSSQALLNDFLTASKFAENIRRNEELPESQRGSMVNQRRPSFTISRSSDAVREQSLHGNSRGVAYHHAHQQ